MKLGSLLWHFREIGTEKIIEDGARVKFVLIRPLQEGEARAWKEAVRQVNSERIEDGIMSGHVHYLLIGLLRTCILLEHSDQVVWKEYGRVYSQYVQPIFLYFCLTDIYVRH